MKRPIILQIVPELDIGGAELSAVEVATAIVKAGGRALVLSEGGRLVARLESAGGEFVPFAAASKSPARIWWNSRKIARMIADEGVDLVHARSRAPAWSAMPAARRTGKPFVTTVHGAHSEKNSAKKFYNSVMARGDIVISNSRFTEAIVRDRYGVPAERSRVIYRGIDPAVLDPAAIASERVAKLAKAWRIPDSARVLLLAARLSPIKGHRTVIEAARLLQERGNLGNAVFVFAGDAQGRDGYVAELNHLIETAGLADRFRLPGYVADVPAALMLAHTALLTSTVPETFGRTVAEAGAMRCPVIASDLGAPPELLVAGPTGTGWLTPPSDAARLADAIELALSLLPDVRDAMGARAREHVVSNFTLDSMREQTLAVYDELLGSDMRSTFSGRKNPQ